MALPDWMRNPPEPKLTWRRRLTYRALRLPGAPALQRLRWRWETRRRLHQRFPILTALLAIPLAFVTIMVMISAVYWLYVNA
ncbi:hypothetical protein [Micromonospora sp. NBC_01813]|uniref:hypothetical protein n=1 Tax=Micromonospora sp. NBC_01813 TaxID=2975988 RepID=UPI002DD969A4|nr:hypothetical protein [Micromonospora sp. NBC_01813]WSA07275.1 hypothetical protein OG958_23880 [Micromonospora sp. NBC_01813]